MDILRIEKLHKKIDGEQVLENVSLAMQAGEILCLLGPSGCGKTTLLRLISGLDKPDSGRVWYNDRDITDVEPHLRNIGMMFQEFALFPHRNVYENIVFGLRVQKQDENTLKQRAREMLELVGLSGMGDRNVSDLSGGERQRVALARSLAPEPGLLLLDEPMGSLDRVLRERLLQDLKQILKQVRITSIFVTHDHTEAFSVADRIAVVNAGRIEQLDSPVQLYTQPANRFVASFLGLQNLYDGTVRADGAIDTGFGTVALPSITGTPGSPVTILIRPEAARLLRDDQVGDDEFKIDGILKDVRFLGVGYQLAFELKSKEILIVNLPNDIELPELSKTVSLGIKSPSVSLIK